MKKVPWLYRRCPQRSHRLLDIIAIVAGGIGLWTYMIGGFYAICAAPVQFAARHPTALLSKPIIWLSHHMGRDVFLVVYTFTQLLIAGLLLYGIFLFDFVRLRAYERKCEIGDKEQEAEEDAISDRDKPPV